MAGLGCLLASLDASALSFTNLIVFGDSIVDQGNTQAVAVGNGFPDPAPASLGYFGGRFTNGLNPADVLNHEIEGSNSVGALVGGDNFAFGGARARDDGDFLPDLQAQTQIYLLRQAGAPIDPNTLIMINVGGNDVRDIIIDNLSGTARQAVIDGAANAVASAIDALALAGAQNFLFVGVGNVGGIPEVGAFGAPIAAVGRQASLDMNAAIQAVLPANAIFFDTIAWSDQLLANPALFGLPADLNTTTACLLAGAAPPAGAPTCDGYAFFDTVHPTTQVLQVLGQELVAVVPEPGTSVLILGGLAALASGRPRRGD
ncbi:MAG: SGNH/GDSL hydrolase family protein [Deltaproteobacteria bacterium]|nr:SGNH/GDSL hydrolase family protein [Deltaproteobacteria bacterium]